MGSRIETLRTCRWCEEERSRAAMDGGHQQTRACRAKGFALRAIRRGLVRIGPLVDEHESYRVARWLPALLRGRAPFEVLPTRARRTSPRRGRWVDPREVWIPAWANLLLSTQPRGEERGETVLLDTGPLVALFRWAGKARENAKALWVIHGHRRSLDPNALSDTRAALFHLFLAANPHQTAWEHRKSIR